VKVMETSKTILGPEHPDTLMSMWNLSLTLEKLDRHVEALSLLQACVRLQDRLLGPAHPHTVAATADLEAMKKP
jgi:Tetratricopeptide repeat